MSPHAEAAWPFPARGGGSAGPVLPRLPCPERPPCWENGLRNPDGPREAWTAPGADKERWRPLRERHSCCRPVHGSGRHPAYSGQKGQSPHSRAPRPPGQACPCCCPGPFGRLPHACSCCSGIWGPPAWWRFPAPHWSSRWQAGAPSAPASGPPGEAPPSSPCARSPPPAAAPLPPGAGKPAIPPEPGSFPPAGTGAPARTAKGTCSRKPGTVRFAAVA